MKYGLKKGLRRGVGVVLLAALGTGMVSCAGVDKGGMHESTAVGSQLEVAVSDGVERVDEFVPVKRDTLSDGSIVVRRGEKIISHYYDLGPRDRIIYGELGAAYYEGGTYLRHIDSEGIIWTLPWGPQPDPSYDPSA